MNEAASAANEFIERFQLQQKLASVTPTEHPPRIWRVLVGMFHLPEDQEWDAYQAPLVPNMPPQALCYAYEYDHPDGKKTRHVFLATEDGRWLEILPNE